MATIKTIIIPGNLSFEIVLAHWVLKKFGEQTFPGISSASVKVRKSKAAKNPEEFSMVGELSNGEKSIVETAIKKCRCGNDAALKRIMRSCFYGKIGPIVLAAEHVVASLTPLKAVEWVSIMLDAVYEENWKFYPSDEYLSRLKGALLMQNALQIGEAPVEREITFRSPTFGDLKMAYVASSQPSEMRQETDLQVSLNPADCSVVIMCRFSARDIIKILRVEELKKAKIYRAETRSGIAFEGIHPDAPQWSYEKMGDAVEHYHVITTGVTTPLSSLSIGEILSLVRFAIDDRFDFERRSYCSKSYCVSTAQDPCPWYHLMLNKCCIIRISAQKG